MIISIASGKGGTGKTTVAVLLTMLNPGCELVDCDVEAPNCHLFVDCEDFKEVPVSVTVPLISDNCKGCGRCSTVCMFNAIAVTSKALVFEELCHSCGSCMLVCPNGAIAEGNKVIGTVTSGYGKGAYSNLKLTTGRLKIGMPAAAPLIKALRKQIDHEKDVIVDCPPGTACSMVAGVKNSDACVLVTEPTPFGRHDLELAIEVVKLLKVPSWVVINKSDNSDGDNAVEALCAKFDVPILAKLPFSREFASGYATGKILPQMTEPLAHAWVQLGGA